MKKLLVLLLGLMCIFVVAGCGKSDGIEGTWVPKMPDETVYAKIELTKQNDFSYKGIITYKDGAQFTSNFAYNKEGNSISEEESDAKKRSKARNSNGLIYLRFNDNYTEAKKGAANRPKDIWIKQ